MTIDAKELREAIAYYDSRLANPREIFVKELMTLHAAAKAHLASLPREVEVEQWVVVGPDGRVRSTWDKEISARAARGHQQSVVRLTGTALLPREKD